MRRAVQVEAQGNPYRRGDSLGRDEQRVNWRSVADMIPGRTGKQVRERWFNQLDPTISRLPWSGEEDSMLLQVREEREIRGEKGRGGDGRGIEGKRGIGHAKGPYEPGANRQRVMNGSPRAVVGPFTQTRRVSVTLSLLHRRVPPSPYPLTYATYTNSSTPFTITVPSPIRRRRSLAIGGETSPVSCLAELRMR